MSWVVRVLYNILLPLFCLLAAPGWILKMARRGGLSFRLWERLGFYDRAPEFEPNGGVYVHAVSVGEVMIALRVIARWLEDDPSEKFVLAATTSTGFAVAEEQAPEGVRVIYSPVDFPILINRLLRRFEPRVIMLVDSELWPNLLFAADRARIPVALVNARLSPRSAGRYQKFAMVTSPILGFLKLVCAQADEHARIWRELGLEGDRVVVTGSVKFDPEGALVPARRGEFEEMLTAFGKGRPVVLAASTHRGEEVMMARAISRTEGALAAVLPRHAERRGEVKAALEKAGFEVILRSEFRAPKVVERSVLVVDSTGEQRDWTAHADLVVIGKSFLAEGGQNPTEAIMAGVPVLCGPRMENFEPLISQLREAGGVMTVGKEAELAEEVGALLEQERRRRKLTKAAEAVLAGHRGAIGRTIEAVRRL